MDYLFISKEPYDCLTCINKGRRAIVSAKNRNDDHANLITPIYCIDCIQVSQKGDIPEATWNKKVHTNTGLVLEPR